MPAPERRYPPTRDLGFGDGPIFEQITYREGLIMLTVAIRALTDAIAPELSDGAGRHKLETARTVLAGLERELGLASSVGQSL